MSPRASECLCRSRGLVLCGLLFVSVWPSSTAAQQATPVQKCIVTDGAALPFDESHTVVKLTITKITGDGGSAIPFQQTDSVPGNCGYQISPASVSATLQITYQLTYISPGAKSPKTLIAQLSSTSPSDLEMHMEPSLATVGTAQTTGATIAPLSRNARAYQLALSLGDEAGAKAAFPIGLLWTPPLAFSVATTNSDCLADLCFSGTTKQNVIVKVADTSEVDLVKEVLIAPRQTDGTFGAETKKTMHLTSSGLMFPLEPAANVTAYKINLPLRFKRLALVSGTITSVATREVVATARTLPVAGADAVFLYQKAAVLNEEVQLVRILATPTEIKLGRNNDNREAFDEVASELNKVLQIRDLALGGASKAVAELSFYQRINDTQRNSDTLFGSISGLSPTVKRTPRQGRPVLSIERNGEPLSLRGRFAVSQAIHVDRSIMELNNREEVGAIVHPGETLKLRLEGPGVHDITSASMHGATVTLSSQPGVVDSVWVTLRVEPTARQNEKLEVKNPDSDGQLIDVTVRPNQRPSLSLAFLTVLLNGDTYRLDQVGLDGKPIVLDRLSGVKLHFDNQRVDSPDDLYGVQYVKVDLTLKDAHGTDEGHVEKCFAIVPPDVNGVRYPVDGSCAPTEGDVSLSDLVDRSYRATARSRMTLGIKLDPSLYPNGSPPPRKEIVLERGGGVIWDISAQLPTGLLSAKDRKFVPGFLYTGAMFNFQPAKWEFRSAFQFAGQAGIVYATPPATGSQSSTAAGVLTLASGVSATFLNMAGSASFDLFLGMMQPITGRGIRSRDRYLVFKPGFSVPVGHQ